MGETVDQIEDQIKDKRDDLRSNLEELGEKVKTAVDWRTRFRANPGAALAIAFGGGFILARIARGTGESPGIRDLRPYARSAHLDSPKTPVLRAWDDIQSALVGVVATKVANTLSDVVPGFREQIHARRPAGSSSNGAGRFTQ